MKLELPARIAALTVSAAILLAACEADGGGNLPTLSPSRTAGGSPSVTAPTATLTAPTRTQATRTTSLLPTATASPAPTPTEPTRTEPTRTETTPTSSPTRTPEPTATPSEPTPTPTETTSPASETSSPTTPETTAVAQPTAPSTTVAAESTAAQSQGVPMWVWLLLAAIVIALALAVPVLLRRRRMDRWLEEFAKARAEVAWLAGELIPQLRQSGSREHAAGALDVSFARIDAAEDQLTGLMTSAPDDMTLERSRILRDALRNARTRLGVVAAAGTDEALATDLDEIVGELQAALAATAATDETTPTPGGAPGPTDQTP